MDYKQLSDDEKRERDWNTFLTGKPKISKPVSEMTPEEKSALAGRAPAMIAGIAKHEAKKAVEASPEFQAGKKSKADHQKAGGSKKKAIGIYDACRQKLLRDDTLSNKDVWNALPDSLDQLQIVASNQKIYYVYRDGAKLVQVDDATGRERSIEYHPTFEKYMTEIREKLGKRPKKNPH